MGLIWASTSHFRKKETTTVHFVIDQFYEDFAFIFFEEANNEGQESLMQSCWQIFTPLKTIK